MMNKTTLSRTNDRREDNIMNIELFNSLIGSVGFTCTMLIIILFYLARYINKKDEQNRSDTFKQIEELKEENKNTMSIILSDNKERESESRKREDKLQNIIAKNQEVISDLANKFDVIKEVKNKVEEIEEQITGISQKMDK